MKALLKTETAMDRAVRALLGKTSSSITSILVARFRKRARRPVMSTANRVTTRQPSRLAHRKSETKGGRHQR
jgi:hypothetical protein